MSTQPILPSETAIPDVSARFAATIEFSRDAIIGKTPAGIITSWSSVAEKLFGYSASEIIGQPGLLLIPPDRHHEERHILARVARGESIHEFETVRIKKDGTPIQVGVSIAPVKDHQGQVIGISKTARDITERKRLEEARRLSETRYRRVFETAQDGILVLDAASGQVLDANPCLLMLLGYSLEELVGKKLWEISPGKGSEASKTVFAELQMKDRVCHERLPLEKKDSGQVEAEFIGSAYFAEERRLIQCNIRDVTARKRVDEALHMQSLVLESMVEGVNVSDPNGITLFSNPACDAMFGYARGTLVGQPISILSNPPPTESRRFAAQIDEELRLHGQWHGEISSRKKDGTAVLTLANISSLEIHGRKCAVAVHEDITKKKQLELHVLRAQRIESVGRLASGIAHDMNNILSPIMMCTPLLRAETKADQIERFLCIIERSAQRGAHLVKQLLFFGRGVEGLRSVMRLKDSVQEMEEIIGQTFPKRITIDSHVSPAAWPVCADPTQIHQVLLNLCVNARDAMPDGGHLGIAVDNVMVNEDYPGRTEQAVPGAYTRLTVTDTGEGIRPEIIDRIFDPFFTTKGIGQATGLGLSTVLGIVKDHDGFVTLQSKVGRGSTFRVHLPALPDSEESAIARIGALPSHGQNETVLIVDDEASICTLAAHHLIRHGYRVISASNGAEAMTAFAAHADEIKLVVTDCDMPVMDGVELIERLRSTNPDLKIIVSTGVQGALRTKTRSRALESFDAIAYLAKPYTANQLLNAVHEILTVGVRDLIPQTLRR